LPEKNVPVKGLRYVSFIIILHFHRKFLSGNQRKILITSGINELVDSLF